MFEIVAIGPASKQCWRREIAPDEVVRLGRLPEHGWGIPWDLRISRDHADLVLNGDCLFVRCLDSARNPAYVANVPQRQFTINPGEQFRIGDTLFRLESVDEPSSVELGNQSFAPELAAAPTNSASLDEIEALRQELAELRRQTTESNPPPAAAEADLGMQSLLEDIQNLKRVWESESQALQESKSQVETAHSQLQEQFERLAAEHQAEAAQRRQSDEQLQQQRDQLAALERRHAEAEAALEQEQAAHQQTQRESQQQVAEVARLRHEREELDAELQDSQGGDKSMLRAESAKLRERCDELTKQLQTELKNRKRAEQSAKLRAEEVEALQSELTEARAAADRLAAQQTETEDAVRRAEDAAQKATAVARREAQTRARQMTEIDKLKGENHALKTKLNQAAEIAHREQSNTARLQDELEGLQFEVESLHIRLTNADADKRQSELLARQQLEEAEQANRDNESLRGELDSLRADLRSKEAALRKSDLVARHKTEEASRYLDELREARSGAFAARARGGSGSGSSSSSRAKPKSSEVRLQIPEGAAEPLHLGSTLFKPGTLERFGQYKIIEQIGQGGMGTVFKALHTRLERIVALKIVTGGRLQSEEHLSRFDREMKAIGRLTHPNLVQALDAGENKQCLYLVMEFVDGLDLSVLVQRVGPLPVPDACEIVRQAAVGLDYIHQQQLVHRDIKPSNLMVTGDQQVKILDLGLALLGDLGDGLTQTGQLMGTLDYMAPEQAGDSHQVDFRADVYSLGCTFYQLLTGTAPYGGTRYVSVVKKILAHAQAKLPSLGGKRRDLPTVVTDLLDRMLAKSADDRPQSLGEVASILEPYAAGASLSKLLAKAGLQESPGEQATITFHTGIDSTNHAQSDIAADSSGASATPVADEEQVNSQD